MELTKYLATGRPCSARLSNEETLEFEFAPASMTGALMDSISAERDAILVPVKTLKETDAQRKKREEAEGSYYTRMHALMASQLALVTVSFDLTIDGNKPDMSTPEKREDLLKQLAYVDLQAIDTAIVEAIRGPLAPDSTD